MSTVEHIEDKIRDLSPEELAEFRNWFLEFDSKHWDEKIEQDAQSGNLDEIAEQALRSYDGGKATEL